ncbi:hypothetical protein SEA_LUCHADOR_53 [Mycobacterium phage Luchador]|uniref:Uncharacterized protein n=1 Tax=Mycobacterium phage Luchador TaxID=1647300 RepID=A0A0F6SJH3_9CAUD|nr:hypothetical protein AVT52_gp51 [Mycobacterium phage Luchador]AKF14217.1 hypothetical protein SEA_LUCHADOR_53 [Mycobacterium phage Luchador]
MSRRATHVSLANGSFQVIAGEPLLDHDKGLLLVLFDDGTSRTFNWDFVVDYYYMTEDEFDDYRREASERNN